MKNFFKSLVVGALLLGSVGCSDMFKEDLYEINQEIDKINARIDSLCNAVNTNIASLQTIIDVMQDNDYVDSIVPIVEGGETVGYEITFTQSGSVKIYHGKKGETGATGHTPIVGVKQAEDGRWYWTVDGEYLLDGEGDKILAEAIDGEDGATGADGITPQLKVEGDYWYISYDNKATWERLGKATGEAGKDGDSMFKSVTYNDEYVELVLVDGTVLRIPTWASHMLLVDEIAKINSNISALQAAVEALESNDYVQKVTPVKDNEGNVVGYTLQFAYAGDVTIYHGEDGKDGEDGEDGKDGVDGKDGYTPVIGARQHPDGIWYWTIDGEWLLDTDGNRVRTTGQDGIIGITPELKIENDYWYVSYDEGQTWTKLGKAKGDDGAAGGDGAAGDAFFDDVDTSNEYYIILTLTDGTEIKIPTWKAHQALADAVAQLNTNFESLQVIITGLQNHDYITGYTPIIDPQTNEEIGYTLHFAKAGDIEIYHGTSPAAPEIGIKKHPQYGLCWTYNGDYIKDPGTGKPVALPQDGADAVAPKFKIEDGRWWMSTDGGRSWEDIGQATGDQGQQGEAGATGGAGDSFFKSIVPEYATDANGNILKDSLGKPIVAYIVMTLAGENEGDEIVYKVPTEYVTDDLNKRLAAIESQFSAISTIVNSLMNAEYIKDVIELYEGPALVGYEITFVKYSIGADGKLTETTRKSTIRNGGTGAAGAAGTVVDAEYDEATDTWYWTLDGEPLVDADGNYVAINGKDGKPGATPQMRINTTTNFWEVSYDGGKTWVSTEVLATGPQGPQGNPGQGGAAGDSFFSNVYKSEDGLYWVFDRTEGEDIMVPTAEAFASLAAKVAALDKSSKAFASLINGKKFIESCEPFSNETGSGYKLVLVSLNAETGEAVKEDYVIFNGKDAETPVVGLRQDETTGDWYWTVDGEDILVDGKPVKANGPQGIDGPVPSFRIDPANGHLYVTVNGTETDLGRVVGTNGSAGEAGSSSSIVVTEGEDGQLTIEFIGGDGLTSTIVVPSWDAFVALQETVSALNTNVEALQAAVAALENNDYVKEVVDIIEDGVVVGYKLIFAKGGEKPIYHGKKGDKGDTPTVSINEDGYWVINGEVTTDKAVPQDGKPGATPKFKIVNGDWYYSYEKDNLTDDDVEGWTYVGRATGPQGPAGTGGEAGDAFFKSVSPVGSDQTTTVPAAEAYYISIELIDGTKYLVPTYKTTDALLRRIEEVNSNVESLSAALNAMSSLQHVISYTKFQEDGKDAGYKLVLTDGPDDDTENDELYIYFGKDGAAGLTPTVAIDENGYWVINGETTTYKAVPENGKPGATPKFKIVNGDWYYSYDQDNVDDEVVEGWTYAGRATGPQGPVGEGGQQGDSFFKNVSYEYAKDANGNILKDQYNKDIVAYIVLTLSDESEYKIPTEWVIKQLEDRLEALERQFSALQTIVSAINNHEYVKKIVGVYEGLKLTGYRITFVTYSVAADGSLQESETEKLINFETTANIPVVGAEQDEQTGVWYWTIDGERIKGADGKDVPMQGPQGPEGQPGHTPVITIGENGNWFIDGVDTGKPSQGVQGETGGSGDSFFKSVQYKDNNNNVVTDPTAAYYIEFTLANNDVIKVPTASAFESLITKLGQLEIKVNGLQDAINLQNDALESLTGTYEDFVAGLETKRFAGVPVYNEETQSWVFSVVDGLGNTVEGAGFSIVQGNVVTIDKPEGSEDYYWFIDGENTGHKVTGNDGQPGPKPEFRINAENGCLEYRFAGEEWQEIGDLTGPQGPQGPAGTNGATNVVFTNNPYPAEGESVVLIDKTDKNAVNNAYWVGVQYGENADDIIWMPTYANFQALKGSIETLTSNVTTLSTLLSQQKYVDSVEAFDDETGTGWVLNLVTYTLDSTGAYVKASAGTHKIYNGVKGDKGDQGQDAPQIGVKRDSDDGLLYWTIGGNWLLDENNQKVLAEGVQGVQGEQGDPGKTPTFKIGEGGDSTLDAGVLYYTYDDPTSAEAKWIKLQNVVGAAGSANVTVDGDKVVIALPGGGSVEVPTWTAFETLQASVTTLNNNVNTLSGLINGKRFITHIDTKWSGVDPNGVQRTGTEIKYVEIVNNVAQAEQTMYIYDGLAGADGTNGATVGVKAWTEGEGADGKLYWTITLNGETSWLLDENQNKVPAVGTDGTPGTDGKTPEFKIVNDVLYWKYKEDVDGTWNELCNVKGDPGDPGKDALSDVKDNGTYYTITYSDGTVVNVAKWVEAGNVTIAFSPSGTLDLGTAASSTVTCTIQGSFGSTAPAIYTTCEGHFTSTVTSSSGSNGSYSYVIEVKATTAYVNDDMVGKLTVYCPYYGSTVIGQLQLKANAKASLGVTSKNGDDDKVTISVGIDEDLNTVDGGRLNIEAMTDSGEPVAWLHMGDAPTKSGRVITQELLLDPNILTAEEAYNLVSPRECTIAIYSPSGREVGRQRIVQYPIVNLAQLNKNKFETANCYIISAPGRYMIPARKGNSSQKFNPTNPSLSLPTDDGANTVTFVEMLTYDGDEYIVFDVNRTGISNGIPSFTDANNESVGVTNGNTVIALKDGSTTLWSWHLWFCASDSRPDNETLLDKYPTVDGQYNKSKVMNRALGATNTLSLKSLGISEAILSYFNIDNTEFIWNDGLYYQWGRKDPLPSNLADEDIQSGDSYEDSIHNPGVFYKEWSGTNGDAGWSSEKSVNDPCPPGYKIPQNKVWRESNPDELVDIVITQVKSSTTSAYAFNLTKDSGENLPSRYIFMPYSSTIVDGKLINNPQNNINISGETPSGVKITTGLGIGSTFYKNVKFTIECNTHQGGFWSTAPQESLKYMHATKVSNAAVKVISGEEWKIERKLSWEGLKPIYNEVETFVGNLSNGSTLSGNTIVDQFVKYLETYYPSYQYSTANALQVRCVKE